MEPSWQGVRDLSEETILAMQSVDYEPSRGFKRAWPSGWCEYASITISEALFACGYGAWTFVQHGLEDEMSGHAWLELRSRAGELVYCIDATLHQFPDLSVEPHFGSIRTPAAMRFTVVNFEGNWRDWKVASYKSEFEAWARATLEHMGL